MVNCSGSSTGALNEDVDLASGRVRPAGGLGAGGGGALGFGTAIARGGDAFPRTSGVSTGLGDFLFFGVGDFSPVVFFFFFDLGEVSLAGDFFDFAFGVASGVSLGVGDASDSSAGVFFFFDFAVGAGEGDFFFLCGEVFGFGVGLGVSSADDEFTARALRTCVGFSWSVGCS
jgi:hypothetical protein